MVVAHRRQAVDGKHVASLKENKQTDLVTLREVGNLLRIMA